MRNKLSPFNKYMPTKKIEPHLTFNSKAIINILYYKYYPGKEISLEIWCVNERKFPDSFAEKYF